MSIKKKILISTIAVLTLVLGGVMVTHADGDTPSAEDLLSTGRTEIDVDNDGIPDAVFDAKDLKDIATSVENGKSSLATSINAYPNADVAPLATFPELSSAIDNLTAVPDIYYYDKATEGDSCVRYMYENGSYYPCNEYGEKTSDTALSGTITVVTKDDTTEPAAGEIQLVKYSSTSAANLSAGSAGYVDKALYLGSGSDNITYRNLGKVGNATASDVLTGKTFTNSSGVGISGTMPNKGAWNSTPTAPGKVTIPAGYHNGNGFVDTSAAYNAGYSVGLNGNGTKSGSISSGSTVNVGYKPRFIYLFYSEGGDYYWNYHIYYIPCFNSSKGYMACYRNKTGSSEQAGARAHQEVAISDYITLTDTGFTAKKDFTYEIAY